MIRSVLVIAVVLITTPVRADEPTLRPDPPAKPVAWPAAVPAIEVPVENNMWATPAEHGGPFLAVSEASDVKVPRRVFDLRTGKKVGEIVTDFQTGPYEALGADGKLLVTITSKIEVARRRPSKRYIAAFDVAAGKQLWATEISDYPNRIRFVGLDKIVIDRRNARGGSRPELYDARTGQLLRVFTLNRVTGRGVSAGSPGGRYVAVVEHDGSIAAFNAADGEVVTRLSLPESLRGKAGYGREVEFSPDGKRLAVAFTIANPGSSSIHVVSWDLATGKQDGVISIPRSPRAAGQPFRWSADCSSWLLAGIGVVDPDTGSVLWKLPAEPVAIRLSLLISANRIVHVDRFTRSQSKQILEVSLPKEKIDAALEAVRAGGLAVDGWLPAPAKADRSAAQALTIPQRADDWTYKPDPVKTTSRKPLKLPLPITPVTSVIVADSAAVCELVPSPADRLTPRRLVRVDLATGKPTGRTELPHVARLADVSPGGEMALTIDTEDTRRVDVWDLGTGKPVAGWRPAGIREPGGELLYASLLSADRVLTLTRGGELAVWSAPGAKAVYSVRVPGLGIPTRSPGRKYLFALQGDAVRVIEAATGKLAGDLITDTAPPPPLASTPGPWTPSPLAMRPDGSELTAILTQPAGLIPQVRRWDLATAKLNDCFGLPRPGVSPTGSVRYAGPDHLLLADSELIGLTSHSLQWRYTRPEAVRLASANDGRFWYAAGDSSSTTAALVGAALGAGMPTAVLVATELPHPTAVAALKAAADNTADNLLGPGKKVGLKLDLDGTPNDKVKESVRATLTDALKVLGLEAADDKAEVVLTATAKSITNGPKVSVRKLLPGENGPGTVEKVDMPFIATRLELTAGGQTIWEGGDAQIPPPYGPQPYRLPAKDTDLTGWLRERAWARLSDTWDKLDLPRSLIRTPAGMVTLPGASGLGPEGPRPIKTQNP